MYLMEDINFSNINFRTSKFLQLRSVHPLRGEMMTSTKEVTKLGGMFSVGRVTGECNVYSFLVYVQMRRGARDGELFDVPRSTKM